jgi:hypothetical protein
MEDEMSDNKVLLIGAGVAAIIALAIMVKRASAGPQYVKGDILGNVENNAITISILAVDSVAKTYTYAPGTYPDVVGSYTVAIATLDADTHWEKIGHVTIP